MRVLIIDQDVNTSDVLIKALESSGLHCSHVTNPNMAISSATYSNPDLILIEATTVNSATMEIVKELRSLGQTADIPIIFLSAENMVNDTVTGLHVGCVEYVKKPVNISTLVETLVGFNCINSIRRITKELNTGLQSLEDKYATC